MLLGGACHDWTSRGELLIDEGELQLLSLVYLGLELRDGRHGLLVGSFGGEAESEGNLFVHFIRGIKCTVIRICGE